METKKQIDLLKSRGMKFSDNKMSEEEAYFIIEEENYYNIINGYSSLFFIDNSNEYLNDLEFKEVYSLYIMDRDLRVVILKYLSIIENNIKSIISKEFTKEYGLKFAYLNLDNYKTAPENIKISLKTVSTLANVISRKTNKDNSLNHYIVNHNDIPLWVLEKYLTLGNVSYLYDALKSPIQNKIALWYSNKFNISKNEGWQDIKIMPEYILSTLKIITLLRNACAHGERIYCFSIYPIKRKNIFNYFKNQTNIDYNIFSDTKLKSILIILRVFLNKDNYKSMIDEINYVIQKYFNFIEVSRVSIILDKMGFSSNWFEILSSLI